MDGTVSVGPSRPPNQFGTLSMAFGLKYWTLRLSLARSQGPRTAGASCQAGWRVRMRSEMDGTVSVGPSRPPNQVWALSMAFGLPSDFTDKRPSAAKRASETA